MLGSTLNSFIYNLNTKQRLRFIEFLSELKSEGLHIAYETGFLSRNVSIDELIENINSTIEWEQIRKLQEIAASKGETTIPEDEWGVHRTHCCNKHGCKYGDPDCPVVINLLKQDYPCEICRDEKDNEEFYRTYNK